MRNVRTQTRRRALGLVTACALALAVVAAPSSARADSGEGREGSSAAGGREEGVSVYKKDGLLGPVRFGPTVGVGAPDGLRFGLFVKYKGLVSVGGAFSIVPDMTIPGLDAQLRRASGEAFVRVHPFRGAFYVGVAGGYVQTKGTLAQERTAFRQVQKVETHAYASAGYIAPHLGFQWQLPFGLTLGCDAGVEIPLGGREPTFDAAKYGLVLPIEGKGAVADAMTYVTTRPVPVVHLAEVGFAF